MDETLAALNNERLKCGEIFYKDGKIFIECFICELIFDYSKNDIFKHLIEHLEAAPKIEDDFVIKYEIESVEVTNKLINIHDDDSNDSISDNKIELHNLDENNVLHCPVGNCEKLSERKEEIISHILETHTLILENDGRYKCGICELEVYTKGSLRSHLRKKHGILQALIFKYNEDGKYKCPECGLICYRPENLSVHIKRKHLDKFNNLLLLHTLEYQNSGDFNVDYEGLKRNRKGKYHDVKFSETDGTWHCPDCDVVKSDRKLILKHVRNYHINNTTCKICNKIFVSSNSLYEHSKTHFEYKYTCSYCNKQFANQSNFDCHVRIHLGDKRYKCNYCDKRFIQSNEKNLHEKIWHLNEKTHQCDICGQAFYTKTKLKYHIQRHTGEKPFECEVCNKRFYLNANLKDHASMHSSNRPFECDLCNSKFKSRKNFLRHKRIIHSDVTEYPINRE